MAGKTYIGNSSGLAVELPSILIGDDNGLSKDVQKIYVGNENNRSVKVWPNPIIPMAYQQVEFLYNTGGTQYIDTGIKPNSDTTTYIEFKIGDATYATTRRTLFGAVTYASGSSLNPQCYALDYEMGTHQRLTYFFGGEIYIYTDYTRNAWHYVKYNEPGGNMYYDGRLVGTSTKTFTAYNANMRLFGSRNTIAPEGLYINIFRAWQNNVLIRDMYPCYRKSDNVIGMYDLVNDQFYTNAGTGIFYKGPDV